MHGSLYVEQMVDIGLGASEIRATLERGPEHKRFVKHSSKLRIIISPIIK